MSIRPFFVFIFLIAGIYLSAQNTNGFIVGVNGGANYVLVVNQMNYGQKEMDYNKVTIKPSYGLQVGYDFNGADIVTLGAGIQKAGQYYKDSYGSGAELEKNIDLQYLAIPLSYMHVFGGKNNPSSGTKFYVVLGPQFNILQDAKVEHKINGKEASLLAFAIYDTDGTFTNANASKLQSLVNADGNVANDKDLFQGSDIQGFLGLGVRHYFTDNFSLNADLRFGYSLTDINADKWQLDGFADGKVQTYGPSKNAYGAIKIGLNYKF